MYTKRERKKERERGREKHAAMRVKRWISFELHVHFDVKTLGECEATAIDFSFFLRNIEISDGNDDEDDARKVARVVSFRGFAALITAGMCSSNAFYLLIKDGSQRIRTQ